jgi:uncharacterized MAPEG superfamily protein
LRIELYAVCFSVVLGLVHIVLAAHAASLQRGYRWTASARDEPMPPLTGVAGRLARALVNFLETFPLFLALIVVVHATDAYGSLSKWGALRTSGVASCIFPCMRSVSISCARWRGMLPPQASCCS